MNLSKLNQIVLYLTDTKNMRPLITIKCLLLVSFNNYKSYKVHEIHDHNTFESLNALYIQKNTYILSEYQLPHLLVWLCLWPKTVVILELADYI